MPDKIAILRRCRCCKQWHSIDDFPSYPTGHKICNRCWDEILDGQNLLLVTS